MLVNNRTCKTKMEINKPNFNIEESTVDRKPSKEMAPVKIVGSLDNIHNIKVVNSESGEQFREEITKSSSFHDVCYETDDDEYDFLCDVASVKSDKTVAAVKSDKTVAAGDGVELGDDVESDDDIESDD